MVKTGGTDLAYREVEPEIVRCDGGGEGRDLTAEVGFGIKLPFDVR